MKENTKKIIFYLCYIGYMLMMIFATQGTSNESVPFFGLKEEIHIIVNNIIWPLVGSLITMLIFSLAIVKLYLKFSFSKKGTINAAYLDIDRKNINHKQVISRLFMTFLLSIGLTATLMESGVIDASNFVTPTALVTYTSYGIDVKYTVLALMGMLLIIIPIAVGILSIGWVLEDAGIISYKFPKKDVLDFYTIEPKHVVYTRIFGGYAGISSVIFYLGAIIYYFTDYAASGFGGSSDLFGLIGTIIIPISIVPVYLVYHTIANKFIIPGIRKKMIVAPDFDYKKFSTC